MRQHTLLAMVVLAVALTSVALTGCDGLVSLEVRDVDLPRVDASAQSFVYAADGSLIATLRFANREPVDREDLPDDLVNAVVAAEDRRFWTHHGVDPRAIIRAWVANRHAGGIVQGGSTITQQLVKNLYFPDAENTLERKALEARMAWELEDEETKDEILTDYFNTVYFGAGANGIEAAAQTYFGVPTSQLSLVQSALLAGLVRSPETTSPYANPDGALHERARVLRAMAEEGYITEAQRDELGALPLDVQPPPDPPDTRFPFFVEYVKRALVSDDRFGFDEPSRWQRLFGGGLRIHTTIDPALQAQAEAAATAFWSAPEDPEVAIAVVRPTTGDVVALVGGRDFAVSQFDLATQGHRQPGSTFKVFALAAALSRGWRLDDEIESDPGVFDVGDIEPWVVDSSTTGMLSLRDAIVQSSNGAFARLALELGPGTVENMAHAMGVESNVGSNPSIVLGGLRTGVTPLEMAGAFATLANGGVHRTVSPIVDITDADGEVVFEPRRVSHAAVDPQTAWLVTDALRQAVEEGTGRAARLDRPAAGKTGTVQNNTDAWFVGFTPQLATAVWIGYPDRVQPLRNIHGVAAVQGGTWPARIWREFMSHALQGQPVLTFDRPADLVQTVEIDPLTGGIATPYCPTTVEVTGLPGELPDFRCPIHIAPLIPLPETGTAASPTPTPAPAARPTPPTGGAPAPGAPVPAPTITVLPTPSGSASPTPTPTDSPPEPDPQGPPPDPAFGPG